MKYKNKKKENCKENKETKVYERNSECRWILMMKASDIYLKKATEENSP